MIVIESIPSITACIPSTAAQDIMGTILFTLALLVTDVILRIAIECNNYLQVTQKRRTFLNILTTFLWNGWGEVETSLGDKRRFLISKGLRNALVTKLTVQYPALFLFATLAFLLPDSVIMGWRFDVLISFVFAIIPMVCEITSIIEKLNLLNADIIKIWGKIQLIYKKWRQ